MGARSPSDFHIFRPTAGLQLSSNYRSVCDLDSERIPMPKQSNGISAASGALLQDLRYAFRVLAQNPGFAAVAVLSLALGIGANTAIFSIVDAVMLKWLPVSSPQELVVIARNPDKPSVGFNYPDYEYFRDHNQVFAGVLAEGGGGALSMTVSGEGSHGGSQLVRGTMVTGNYFAVLGVTPALGRLFTSEDNKTAGGHPVAILSYDFWRNRFGGDPRVLGRKITLNGYPFTIIGVSRQGFT